MADWNQPTNTSTYSGVLATLNEKIADAAKMDFTGDTNLPVGAKRHDSSTKKFQEWNGTSWVDISVHFGADVGIGNTSPGSYLFNGSPLLAVGSSSTNGTVSIVSSTTGLGYLAFADGTSGVDRYRGLIEYSHAANFMRFYVDGAERIRISTGGSLGIGTASPSQRLHVSDGTSSGDVRVMLGDATNNVQLIRNGASDAWLRFTGTQGLVDVSGANPLIFRTNSIERMRIDGAGDAIFVGQIEGPNGSAGAPAFSFSSDTNTGIYLASTDMLGFATAGTERVRIASNGILGINDTTGANQLLRVRTNSSSIPGAARFNTQYSGDLANPVVLIEKFDTNNTTSQIYVRFNMGLGATPTGSGQIVANGANQAAFATFSDISLKENVVPLGDELSNLCSLKPCEFDYKDGSGHQVGFIAQEVQVVYPDLVAADENGLLMLAGLSKNEARLIRAIQQLAAKVEALEAT